MQFTGLNHIFNLFLPFSLLIISQFPLENRASETDEDEAISSLDSIFRQRFRHKLIPMRHAIRWYNGRPSHRRIFNYGRRTNRLEGPDKTQIEVCNVDANGLPCTCPAREGLVDCSDETLKTTWLKPVYDSASHPQHSRSFVVRKLNMRNNALTELWQNKILPGHLSSLEVLDLSRNRIVFIGDHAFQGMTRLITLDLSHNRLAHLTRNIFVGSDGLEWRLKNLYLNDNGLRRLDDGLFNQLSRLERLIMDNNPTILLTDRTFGFVNNLHDLSMENCGLRRLPPLLFEKLRNLRYLSLRGNPLTLVPAAVKSIHSLTGLDISATDITEFTEKALMGDYKLKELIVRDMPYLWAIESCAFCGMQHLQEVVFYNCSQLYSVSPNAFGMIHSTSPAAAAENIRLIDLEKCNISSLVETMLPWTEIDTLKLGLNPYKCDCNLVWMTDQELDLNAGTYTPACSTPVHLKGRPLNVLRAKELCPNNNNNNKKFGKTNFGTGKFIMGLLMTSLALLTALLAWCLCCNREENGKFHRKLAQKIGLGGKGNTLFHTVTKNSIATARNKRGDYCAYSNLVANDDEEGESDNNNINNSINNINNNNNNNNSATLTQEIGYQNMRDTEDDCLYTKNGKPVAVEV